MDKVCQSVDEAVADIPDGASIAIAGFFTAGTPVPLIQALARQGARNLTIISQQMGPGNGDLTQLVVNGQMKKAVCNYPFYRSVSRGANSPFEQAVRAGKIELEVYPMGTFIEKLRTGGAGIAGFYTPTGAGTIVAEGKEKRSFNGREYLLETALTADFAYLRFHGRNVAEWWTGTTETRYRYLYPPEEIRELAGKAQAAAAKTKLLFGFFNNHWQAYSPRNAVHLLKEMHLPFREITVSRE